MPTTPQDFATKLKDHLLTRILNKQYDAEPPTFNTKDRDELYIAEDRLEQRYCMNLYHTTYDLRRGKDRVNMKNRSHIMTLSQDESHPYAYAKVLGIYRLDVLHGPTMSDEVTMDVLWVRWLKIDKTHRAGWKAKRLYRVKYVLALEDDAFGFLDPDDIVRGSHLIPKFNHGHKMHAPGDPTSLWDPEKESDWKSYYVNQWVNFHAVKRPRSPLPCRFVDRDMFMRYRGGGVGHKYMREVETKHENMSLERTHRNSHPKPSHNNNKNAGVSGTRSRGKRTSTPDQTGGPLGDDLIPSGGDESDEEYVPPETDGSDDEDSTDSGGDSGNETGPASSEADEAADEIGSNGGYESYGLADL